MTLEKTYLTAKYLIDTGKISQDIFRDLMDTEIVAVVHAHWVMNKKSPYGYNCSNCGAQSSEQTNYCKDCGAKMDEKVVAE